MAKDPLDEAEKVGIKGRLVENSNALAQPIPAGDFLRPLIVSATVADRMVEKRGSLYLVQIS